METNIAQSTTNAIHLGPHFSVEQLLAVFVESVLVDDALPSVLLPHDVDDVAAFLKDSKHLVESAWFHVTLGEAAGDNHYVVLTYRGDALEENS